MFKVRLNLRKVVAIAICLAGFLVNNVLAQDNTKDHGVVINGVKWATRNVDMPGTFADKPEDAGMFYQWNRRVGWSVIDPMINSNGGTTWDSSTPVGDTWEKSNDPSPAGWRVPTLDEIKTLLDTVKVKNFWIMQKGVFGTKFIDKATGNTLFLPIVNYRTYEGILWNGELKFGQYWSSTADTKDFAHFLMCNENGVRYDIFSSPRREGNSVRPVAK